MRDASVDVPEGFKKGICSIPRVRAYPLIRSAIIFNTGTLNIVPLLFIFGLIGTIESLYENPTVIGSIR